MLIHLWWWYHQQNNSETIMCSLSFQNYLCSNRAFPT